ncbi:MAG: putative Fe-S cluster assembly protein SufT [Pseudomonadota bacterium]
MFGNQSEPVVISRDVEAIVIPSGEETTLPEDAMGYITQALGGSFTVYLDGHLFRIAGHDADALGKEPTPRPELPDGATNEDVEKLAWDQMRTCFDPEIPVNVVDLGLIYDCNFDHGDGTARRVDVVMTLTAPGCGMGDVIVADVREKLLLIPTLDDVRVELTFEPAWDQNRMSEAARLQTGMMY